MWLNQAQNCLFSARNECSAASAPPWSGGEGLGAGWWGHLPAPPPWWGLFLSPLKEPCWRVTLPQEHAGSPLCKGKTSAAGAGKQSCHPPCPWPPVPFLHTKVSQGPAGADATLGLCTHLPHTCQAAGMGNPPRSTWPRSLHR